MTITSDELKRLEAERRTPKQEMRYEIDDNGIKTQVHSNLASERIGKLNKGHRVMNEAVQRFRDNMTFRSREGLAKSQFQKAHEGKLPPVDTDAGYGAGNDNASVERYVNHGLNQREVIRDERVKVFAKRMSGNHTQHQDLDR